MGRNQIVKICCIAGFLAAEAYMTVLVLAPYKPELAAKTRMIIPKEMIPPEPGIGPNTPTPPGTIAVKLAVCAFFFGPFGAFVGFGAGLLIEGARQKIVTWRSASRPQE